MTKRLCIAKALAAALFILEATPSLAEVVISLFDANGNQSATYDQDIERVTKGDVLRFEDRDFKIVGTLGQGGNTKIFELENGRALRVPLRSGLFFGVPYVAFIDQYYAGAVKLAAEGVPVPQVYATRSGQYIEVEKLNVKFSIGQLLRKEKKLTKTEYVKVINELVEFAGKTAKFLTIADFYSANVLYTDRGWIDADFHEKVEYADTVLDYSPSIERYPTVFDTFDIMGLFDRPLKRRIVLAIMKNRRALGISKQHPPCNTVNLQIAPRPASDGGH
jgi:hypothetical protein